MKLLPEADGINRTPEVVEWAYTTIRDFPQSNDIKGLSCHQPAYNFSDVTFAFALANNCRLAGMQLQRQPARTRRIQHLDTLLPAAW